MRPSGQPPPPPYAMLNENNSPYVPPPPGRRSLPMYNHDPKAMKKKKGGCSCLKCICCCCCLLFLIILVIAGLLIFFYFFYKPEAPKYNVQNFEVKSFSVHPDFSLDTDFLVTVKAENPNSKIGFIYEKGSSVGVEYKDSTLCTGKVPAFTQGTKNTTIFSITLTGKSEFGSGLQEALMDSQKKGHIPLLVRVIVPVKIVVFDIPLKKVTVTVKCSLVVDNLSPQCKAIVIFQSSWPEFLIQKNQPCLRMSRICNLVQFQVFKAHGQKSR